MSETTTQTTKQGAVIGGWVCLALGTGLMLWSLLSFLLYLPLFLAAFVLGIVAIAQRRLWNGIPILLLSVVVPLVLGLGLGAYRTQQVLDQSRSSEKMPSGAADLATQSDGGTSQSTLPASPSPEELYIRDHIELYEFEAKYTKSFLDGSVPGITFKLKNKGDRTLDRVKVLVLFKDASGAVISEEDYFPVLVLKHWSGDDNKPLKPGYIWQMERGKFYSAKSVPSEWKEGAAEARITEIRFSENPAVN